MDTKISPEDSIKELFKLPRKLASEISTVYLGAPEVVNHCVATFIAGGHILLEDMPGVGKTTLARTMAKATGLSFSRIQCTPDLLPSDVIGFSIPLGASGEFRFKKGPVFSNVVIVDEINRAAPRTQSAFLEAMEENQVTSEGETRNLPDPFFIIATQNPVEIAGTYPLPESQTDRFDMRISLGYPHREGEIALIRNHKSKKKKEDIAPVIPNSKLPLLFELVETVKIADSLIDYVYRVGLKSRRMDNISLGISTRGLISWVRVAKALAIIKGRDFTIPEDLHEVAGGVLAHRLVPKKEHLGLVTEDPYDILKEILESVQLPV